LRQFERLLGEAIVTKRFYVSAAWISVLFMLAIVLTSKPALPAELNGRPYSCPRRAWCGCWLDDYLGTHNKSLWVARNWLRIGRPVSRPAPGVVAVYARGHGGHVGIVTAVPRQGVIVMKSGNDDGMVRERERSTAGVIGYRRL
jgi:uncharacterized protein (TIGR02594 family)